ncbi:MAG: MaoC family dehydratase N-terminal domain-containing protein [Chloroflexi bacterium]|nr:MaoC family dehydratase N-terminal domain-containing protein [Chloroflexota bacterium]
MSTAEAYDVDRVRAEWLGRTGDQTAGDYLVEYEPIRRFCHMIEDANPLFLDPEYARTTTAGDVVCPPTLVDLFSRSGAWPRQPAPPSLIRQVPTPGRKLVNLNQETEWFAPVKVGDRLTSVERIADIELKPTRLDPLGVALTTEYVISNQRGEVVCLLRNQLLIHRSKKEIAASGEGEGTR